jgi:hypothetical protein
MSLGVSGSASAESANRISTGPVAFGSVSANAAPSTPSWVWIVLSAAGALVAVLLFRRH